MKTVCRLIFGITFILSGFFKFIDPIGTGLIVKEYLEIFHLGFLENASIWIGIIMSSAEFIIGASVILGLRMRIMSSIALIFIGFFTLLTLYLALFNPIEDCGCFGEAIHLTNWQTFEKNVILQTCCIVFFAKRKEILPIAPKVIEWSFIAVFALIALSISIHSYKTLPFHDFTAYKLGTDLNDTSSGAAQYVSTFIYSKDGQRKEFTMDNLPDDSWTYEETITELIEGSTEMAQIDLALSDTDGNYWTDELFAENALSAIVVWDPYNLSDKQMNDIKEFISNAESHGMKSVVFDAAASDNYPTETYFADRKALMTLNRSNGGAVIFHNGIITNKIPSNKITSFSFENEDDYELSLLRKEVLERFKFSLTLIGIFIFILLIRYSHFSRS